MKWIYEFWRSFCELSVTGGDFWLTTPCQLSEDEYSGGEIYFGVPQTVLAGITSNCLTQLSYIKTAAENFSGHLVQVVDGEISAVRQTVIPSSRVKVLRQLPGNLELTLHPNFVHLRVQFSCPNASRAYCAFSLRADCLQIVLNKKEIRDSGGVWVDLSLSAAVTFEEYYPANDRLFILLSREQVKKLLPLPNPELCRELFALFGYGQISDTPGKYGTPFGCVTIDLVKKMEEFASISVK